MVIYNRQTTIVTVFSITILIGFNMLDAQETLRDPTGMAKSDKISSIPNTVDIPVGKRKDIDGREIRGREAALSGWGGNVSWLSADTSKENAKPDGTPTFDVTVNYRRPLVPKSPDDPPPWARTTQSSAFRFSEYYWHRNLDQGDIIPVFGELYRVSFDEKKVQLTKITSQVPAELRPLNRISRTITTKEHYPELFCEFDKDFSSDSRVYDEVREFEIDATDKSCGFTLIPFFQKRRGIVPKRKPLKVVVKAGDLICARNKCFRVLKVVPKQNIKGAGQLVGWIELESEPVTKKPTDPIAKIEEIPSDPKHYQ